MKILKMMVHYRRKLSQRERAYTLYSYTGEDEDEDDGTVEYSRDLHQREDEHGITMMKVRKDEAEDTSGWRAELPQR